MGESGQMNEKLAFKFNEPMKETTQWKGVGINANKNIKRRDNTQSTILTGQNCPTSLRSTNQETIWKKKKVTLGLEVHLGQDQIIPISSNV